MGRRRGGRRSLGRRFGRVELNAADIQIFLETVELEEVGELESSDISASLADFPLEIADNSLEIGFVEPGVEELIPEPLPIKAQAQALASELAVQRVSLWDPLGHEVWRVRPPNPGTCSMACCMVWALISRRSVRAASSQAARAKRQTLRGTPAV